MNWLISPLVVWLLWSIGWNQHVVSSIEYGIDRSSTVCDFVVDAGPDTNVCFPGGTLTLQGSTSFASAVFTQWSPATGLSSTSILNPVANITGPITYTLTGWALDPNSSSLVTNGDFELGNTGFTSNYTYAADITGVQNELVPAGTYTVINNPNLVHGNFSGCSDHTPGGVNMMVVNGAPSLQDIWCQTISLSANTWFNVSAWAASVHSASPAILRFSINGIQIGSIVNVPSSTCQWVPFNASWYSASNTTATICVVNLNTATNGNDFALDDISIRELCMVEDEVEITLVDEDISFPPIIGPSVLCAGDIGEYSVNFPALPAILSYQWELVSGGTILDGQGTPNLTVQWEDPSDTYICLFVESRCDEASECLNILVNDLPDAPFISGPSGLCPGEIVTLYTSQFNPDYTYDWILPPEINLVSGQGTNEIDIEWALEGETEICLVVTNDCGINDQCFALTLYPDYHTLFDTVLCSGTTVIINGNTYGNGIWSGTEIFTDIHGCDSLVEIDISEADTLQFLFSHYICEGDSIFAGGSFQTESGVYTEQFVTVSGCDSVVTTELFITQPDSTWITTFTCNPSDADTIIDIFTNAICDSTVIHQIVFVRSDTILLQQYSCIVADTGRTEQLFANQAGCDSLVITQIDFLLSDTTYIFQSSCDPSQAGQFTLLFTNTQGCDSLVITNVSFSSADTTYLESFTCFYADTGTTTSLFVNTMGCDSLIIQSVTYTGSDTTYLFTTTCSVQDSGLVVTSLLNQFGCDSIISTYTTFIFSDTTYLIASSCDPLDTGMVIQQLINMGGCDSMVITTTSLDPPDVCVIQATFTLVQPLCYGDIATLNISVEEGLGPFDFMLFNPDTIINQQYPGVGSYSLSFGGSGMYSITLASANGLSVTQDIIVFAPAPLWIDATLVNSYNGYGVPCYDDEIGSIMVEVLSSGTPPLSFLWSPGDVTPEVMNLGVGTYSVTVTDTYGCFTADTITIIAPEELSLAGSIADILCFGGTGSVSISEISGGITPYLTSIDGNSFQTNLVYAGLQHGIHQLVVQDQNGCEVETSFSLDSPSAWQVSIGPDTIIPFGSTFVLPVFVTGIPNGAVNFQWSDQQCENCDSRSFEMTNPITLSVIVTDENGCSSEDEIQILVKIDRGVYIPNIFSPNDDQVNDLFLISSNALIEISEMSIYDRWGNVVFEKFNFQPTDPSTVWDGTFDGKPANPGVFTYKVLLKFKDGKEEVKYGDVTLIR